MKTLKRLLGLTAAATMALGVFLAGSVDAEAASAIRKTAYDGNGEVEIDFNGRVQFRNPTVTVKDQNGKTYTARITDRDEDEMEFRIQGYKTGLKYQFTISGIKTLTSTGFGKVTGTVTIPGGGWVKQNGKWYYFAANGQKATGWVRIKGDWYYMNSAGIMQTGWIESGGKWFYLDRDGEMETGWEKIAGKWYYFDKTGAMVSNTTRKIGTRSYKFNASGACVNP